MAVIKDLSHNKSVIKNWIQGGLNMKGSKLIILFLIIVNVVTCSSIEKTKYQAPGTKMGADDSIETKREVTENRYSVNVERVVDGIQSHFF